MFVGEPTYPRCRIRVRVVGLFRMQDEKGPDEKILCVPVRDPQWSHFHELEDLLPTLRAEVEHFFSVYKSLEDKNVDTKGFGGRAEALQVIQEARRRAREEGRDGTPS